MELKVLDVVKKYNNKPIVDGVSLEVKEGEIIGLLGPNGAGKTTTFYMVVGLIQPDRGEIFLGEKKITRLAMFQRARLGLGYLAQEPSIFRRLTVEENIMAILESFPISSKEQKEKAKYLMEELGIAHLAKQKAYLLSGGEKRRTEIARALTTNPKFLLLDEPFLGIDPVTVSGIQSIVAHLREKGLGILITDHNVWETLAIIDRAYIIYEGRLLFSGTAKELLEHEGARKVYLGDKFQAENLTKK